MIAVPDGYAICSHCNGYGSSLKEEAPICTKCYGSGLIKTKLTVNDLHHGQVVRMRMGRYVEHLSEPLWTEWQDRAVLIQRDKKGLVCSLTPAGIAWAEYDPRNSPPEKGILLCEDYYLEIADLTP